MCLFKSKIKWKPIDTVPMDGTVVLLRMNDGKVVSAWFCFEPATNDALDDGMYDWICFDDMFQLDGHSNNIVGWHPLED